MSVAAEAETLGLEFISEASQAGTWFAVAMADLRTGDVIRFTSSRGRRVEGPVVVESDLWAWCNFETITPALVARWAKNGDRLYRLNLPALTHAAYAILDAVPRMDEAMLARLADTHSMPASAAYDLLLAQRCSLPWWDVWVHARNKTIQHVRSLPLRARRFEGLAAESVASAVVATTYARSISPEVYGALVRGFRSARRG